jgi:prepilin-type N-terminal cleavage/methylation domain-containing protein
MKKERLHINKGFSLIEVILSTAVFGLFVVAFMGVYLYGEESTMLSGNRARAVMLAEEAVEATRNIRDPDFANLADGTYGLTTTGNQYNLEGPNDTDGFFTRSVNVATVDAKRKDITSTVTWQQNAQRTGSVSIVSRLTNWIATGGGLGLGILIYGDGTTIPKYRTYDSTTNIFSAETSAPTSSAGRTYVIRTSPVHSEAIAGFVTATGVLNVMCFNGTSWTNEWTATVGGTGTTRRFDISYETGSGDAIVLYSTNTTTTNELAYQTKPGGLGCGAGNWSGAMTLNPIRTSGIIHWVKMAWDRRTGSDLITTIWADGNSDLSAMVWDGDTWGNEPSNTTEASLERISTSQDTEDFDVEYESLSGDVMVVWSNSAGNSSTNGARYRTCTGGLSNCTWSAIVTNPPNWANDATNLDISANPDTNEIVFASIGNGGSDMQLGYWSGSAWTNSNDVDTSCTTPGTGATATKMVSTGWLVSGSTYRSIVRYVDQGSNALDWYTGNAGVFKKELDWVQTPAPNGPKYLDIQMNPLIKNQIMSFVSDSVFDLTAKKLEFTAPSTFTWTDSDGAVLEASLPQATNSPYSFAFSRN